MIYQHGLKEFFKHFTRATWRQLLLADNDTLVAGKQPAFVAEHWREIKAIYLPLLNYIHLRYEFRRELQVRMLQYTQNNQQLCPYLLGVVGGVAVGKTSFTHLLQQLLQWQMPKLKIATMSTDGFVLASKPTGDPYDIKNIKRLGFTNCYNWQAILQFFAQLRQGKYPLQVPTYLHQSHMLSEELYTAIDAPDILIIEGGNLLCPMPPALNSGHTAIADFLDDVIYLDATLATIAQWYLQRHKQLSAEDEVSEKQMLYWRAVWDKVHLANLYESILPYQTKSHIILHKRPDHHIESIWLRNYL